LVTGYDIIFFWVVRMVFSALEQTGEVPFDNVFLTGLVRDSQGRKMSKSLGNGIDPLDVIDKYGADALRFTLVTGNSPGNDMRFYMERVESSRNFANKLWNATRFVMMNIDEDIKSYDFDTGDLEEEDKWILSRKNNVVREITENLDKYELGMAAQKIYDFIWDEFCDWYIEIVKGRLYGTERKTKETAQKVLLIVLKDILKMLHPFMPFITEEIWRYLPDEEKPLIISSWPVYRENINFPEAERSMEYIMNAIKGIRNIRSEMNVEPKRRSNMIFVTQDEEIKKVIDEGKRYFVNLAFANDIYIRDSKDGLGEDNGVVVLEKCEIYLPMRDLIDFEKERERLEREREKLESELKRVRGKLSNKGFIDKAPKEVVEAEREKETKYKDMMDKVLERLNIIKNN